MDLKIFSIRDSAAEYYTPPFFKRSHGEAERDFTTLVNDGKSTVHNRPEHFSLYHVGKFDDSTGTIVSLPTPEHVVKAVDVIERKNTLNAL